MKNKFFILLLLLSFSACDIDYGVTIGCDPQTKEMGLAGGSFTVNFKSYVKWSATTKANWLTIDPEAGMSDTIVTVIVDSTSVSRKGTITFDNGYATTTLTINQIYQEPEDSLQLE